MDKPDVEFVTMNHLSDMHAEMKLLSSLENDYPLDAADFVGLRIGVSKPCCCLCAAVLDSYGVTFSMYHTEDTYWLSPFAANTSVGGMNCQKDDDKERHVRLHLSEDFPDGVDINKIRAF